MMLPINMRETLTASKFNYLQAGNYNENVLWNVVNSGSLASLNTSSVFQGVLASFETVRGDHIDSAQFKPVHGGLEEGLEVFAIPPDRDTLVNALKWLDPQAEISEEASEDELSRQYILCLNNSPIPNGTVETLTDFIKSRTWNEKRLWGGTMEKFWNMVDSEPDPCEKWRLLRLFITYNIAWTTKVLWLPIEGLHRSGTFQMSYTGVYLPQSPLELIEAVLSFSKMLVPVDENHQELCIRGENRPLTVVDGLIRLSYCLPPSFDDENFYVIMKSLSAEHQLQQGRQSTHTVLNLLGFFLYCFKVNFAGKLGFLYYPGDSTRGIEATLCGMKTREQFHDLLVRDHLCDTDDTDSWEVLLQRIESCSFQGCWENVTRLSEVYIALWLEKFSKVAYRVMRDKLVESSLLTEVDPALEFKLIPNMTLEVFQMMFQKDLLESQFSTVTHLDSYRLNPDCLPKHPIILTVFSKKKRRGDVIAGNPYQKYFPKAGGMKERFPGHLMEFLWLILYAHFSAASFKSISLLTDQPTLTQHPASNDELLYLSRRYIRCVVFSISVSVTTSARVWDIGYFPKDRSTMIMQANKMLPGTRKLFLTMSAISETCPFFQKMGINPDYPPVSENIPFWIRMYDGLENYEKLLLDPVFVLTFLFCHQVHMQEKEGPVLTKDYCCKLIDATLKCLGDPNLETVTSLRPTHSNKTWLGNCTVGGHSTLSMSPDPKTLPILSDKKGHLLVVLRDDHYHHIPFLVLEDNLDDVGPQDRPVTHSITQFDGWDPHLDSFTNWVEENLGLVLRENQGDVETEIETDEEVEIEANEEVDVAHEAEQGAGEAVDRAGDAVDQAGEAVATIVEAVDGVSEDEGGTVEVQIVQDEDTAVDAEAVLGQEQALGAPPNREAQGKVS